MTWTDFDAMGDLILLADEQAESERFLVHVMLHNVSIEELPRAPQLGPTLLML